VSLLEILERIATNYAQFKEKELLKLMDNCQLNFEDIPLRITFDFVALTGEDKYFLDGKLVLVLSPKVEFDKGISFQAARYYLD
jgi:hypothetical protein